MKYYSPSTDEIAEHDHTKTAPNGKVWVFIYKSSIKDDKPNDSVLLDYESFIQKFYEAIK